MTEVTDLFDVVRQGRDITVKIPYSDGRVYIHFSEISRAHQSFTASLVVIVESVTEGVQDEYRQRVDISSHSAVEGLRRSLQNAYDIKSIKWAIVLNKAFNAVVHKFNEEKKPEMADTDFKPVPFLLKPFLQKDVANMLFGNSEVGKTYFALQMAACAASGKDFFGYPTAQFKTLFLDFEDSRGSFSNRLHELAIGLEVPFESLRQAIHYYQPEASIRDESEVVAKMVVDGGYGLIIIDAGADASGGSPNDETKVLEMFNSLNNIPCTKLLIHHEPKNTEGVAAENAYYGTAFWRARVRVAWRLTVENHDGFTKTLKATATKASNMAPIQPFNYTMTWGGSEVGKPSLRFDTVDDFKPTDEAKILTFLAEGEAGTESIADAVGLTRTTTQRKLSEMLEKDLIERRRDDSHVRRILWHLPGKGEKA